MLFGDNNQEKDSHFLDNPHNRASSVQIQTKDGKTIKFTLLDAQVVEMLNGITYLQGKSYDVFADPNHDNRKGVNNL